MEIIEKKIIADALGTRVIQLKVKAALIAESAQPGQFVVVMVKKEGERIPLTLVDSDKGQGTITLIVQELGYSTGLLAKMDKGNAFYSLLGPLGHPTAIVNYGKIILLAGGVGIAEIYPVAKALAQAQNQVTVVIGARTKELLILENRLNQISHQFYLATDDGSKGEKGFTTDILAKILPDSDYKLVYAVGPVVMMKKAALIAARFKVNCLVSLNSLMVDASGMCGSCRIDVGGQVKFVCVDGPEFPAELIDWDSLEKRNNAYREKENHICNLDKL